MAIMLKSAGLDKEEERVIRQETCSTHLMGRPVMTGRLRSISYQYTENIIQAANATTL